MARPRKDDPKSTRLTARFTEAEADAVKAHADAADIHVSDLLRAAVLRQPAPTRTRRKPRQPVEDGAQLAQVLGAVGRIGSNVNQLARTANMGGWGDKAALDEAVADIRWMRDKLMLALGVAPAPPSPSKQFGGR